LEGLPYFFYDFVGKELHLIKTTLYVNILVFGLEDINIRKYKTIYNLLVSYFVDQFHSTVVPYQDTYRTIIHYVNNFPLHVF